MLTHQFIRRSLLPMLVLLFVLPLAAPERSLATDLPIYGGLGGNTDREDCPKGSYLVGLEGSTDAWVDRVAPVCAPWLRGSQAFGAPSVRRSFGWSTGGNKREKRCTDTGRSLAIQSWWIRLLRSDDHYVQSIEMYCDSLPTPFPTTNWGPRLEFGTGPVVIYGDEIVTGGPFSSQPPFQACPAGEVATGIRVRAGKYVDAIGLICGPVPARVGAPSTRLPRPLVQAPSLAVPMTPINKNMVVPPDQFIITKPTKDEKVPQGRLVIMAIAPKVGMTNVTELELRCLDASPDQQHSYPYTTYVSVDTSKLLQGYPVEQIVTEVCKGHWQVQVRSSMKTPPGPWSAPVRFQMVKAPPPPPMVQTPRPNAPITPTPAPGSSMMQAPAPSVGVAPTMVRPPTTSSGGAASSFMIRPRGVEEPAKEKDKEPIIERGTKP